MIMYDRVWLKGETKELECNILMYLFNQMVYKIKQAMNVAVFNSLLWLYRLKDIIVVFPI